MDKTIEKLNMFTEVGGDTFDRIVCPICGPRETRRIGTSNRLPIVRCAGCDLIYVSECPSLNRTQEYFREAHKKDIKSTRKAYVDYRKKSLRRAAARIRNLMPEGGRLLDVGTASGFFLKLFGEHANWNVEGVEPSRVSAEFARQTFGVKVHQGFFSEQNFPAAVFDIVCSLDAFGCHRNPRDDMLEFERILTPGGLLAIEIPGHWFRMITSSGWIHRNVNDRSLRLQAGVNFFCYTRTTLTRLASLAGFEFFASYPEGLPATGNRVSRATRMVYDAVSATLYRATYGHLNVCAKELCVFRKPSAPSSCVLPGSSALPEHINQRAG